MKRLTQAFAVALILLSWSPAANAGQSWFLCNVDATGLSGNRVLIRLSDTAADPAFSRKWFQADDRISKEVLATALSIITADLKAWVRVDPDGRVPVIGRIYARQ